MSKFHKCPVCVANAMSCMVYLSIARAKLRLPPHFFQSRQEISQIIKHERLAPHQFFHAFLFHVQGQLHLDGGSILWKKSWGSVLLINLIHKSFYMCYLWG